jgi:hypothetical protein
MFEFLDMVFFVSSRIVQLIRMTLEYGPDLRTFFSKEMKFREAQAIALKNWEDQAFVLLPRQYAQILARLEDEGLLLVPGSHSIPDWPMILKKGALPVWITYPPLIKNISPKLWQKIKSFDKDRLKLQKYKNTYRRGKMILRKLELSERPPLK